MIHGENLESLRPDILLEKKYLAQLKVPFHPVVGNHENVQREGDPRYEAAFREAFDQNHTNYTVRHKDFLFIMLNNSGVPRTNSQAIGQHRNEWFRAILDRSVDQPKFICCHIPLIPLRDESVLKKSFGFNSYCAKDEELINLVDQHAESIIAVLSGHLHLTGVVVRHGVHHISLSGTASYPGDFASYDVFPDRIQVLVHSLPQKLQTPDTNIHGKPRHEVDYTDSEHPIHEAYIKGNVSERQFEILR